MVNDPFAQHGADFVRYNNQYVISCTCGYKSATTVRKQAIQRVERHNGVRYIEASGPDVVHNDPNVGKKARAPRMAEAAHGMSATMLERANICADCGGTLRNNEGAYGVRWDRISTIQWPVCSACKLALLALVEAK